MQSTVLKAMPFLAHHLCVQSAIMRALERRTVSRSDGIQALDDLADKLLDVAGQGDMSALREFAKLYPDVHTYLPSIFNENKRAELNHVTVPGEAQSNSFNGKSL